MNITESLIEKAKTASSAADLIKIAEAEGITLTKEEAEAYYSFYFKNGELSDEELENVAGGKGNPKAKYQAGQRVKFLMGDTYLTGTITKAQFVDLQGAWYYTTSADDGQVYHYEVLHNKVWDLALELSVFHTTVIQKK